MLRPLHDKVVIERLEKEDISPGGIIVPEQAQEKPQRGVVLACGPGWFSDEENRYVPMDVKVGDIVLFGKYAGIEIKDGERDVLIVREEDILGIVEDRAD